MNKIDSDKMHHSDKLEGDLAGIREGKMIDSPKAETAPNQTFSDDWSDFDFSKVKIESARAVRALTRREILQAAIIGFLSGFATWLIYLALNLWILQPLFCRTSDTATICASSNSISFAVSLIIIGMIAMSILTSRRVSRATLVTLASFVTFSALWNLLNSQTEFLAPIFSAIFMMLIFLLFTMISAIQKNLLAPILSVIFVAAFWLFVKM